MHGNLIILPVRSSELSEEAVRRQDAELLYRQAVAKDAAGKSCAALRLYCKALRLDPDHADALLNVGVLLHGKRKLRKAEVFYRRALEVSEGLNPQVYYNLGLLCYHLHRIGEAEEFFQKAVQMQRDYTDALYGLLLVNHFRRNNPFLAMRYAEAFLRCNPTDQGQVDYARKVLAEKRRAVSV